MKTLPRPDVRKNAIVVSLCKGKHVSENYRQIKLLSVPARVLIGRIKEMTKSNIVKVFCEFMMKGFF